MEQVVSAMKEQLATIIAKVECESLASEMGCLLAVVDDASISRPEALAEVNSESECLSALQFKYPQPRGANIIGQFKTRHEAEQQSVNLMVE